MTLQFLDFEAKGLKSRKGWGKKFKVGEMCEVLILVEGKAEVRMEVLCRRGRSAWVFVDVFEKRGRILC